MRVRQTYPKKIVTLGLVVSYEMGWQKQSTGHRYDSTSGHGFIIGYRSGRIIGLDVKGGKFAKCYIANKKIKKLYLTSVA